MQTCYLTDVLGRSPEFIAAGAIGAATPVAGAH
jgi:hypothetical protein